MSEKDTGQLENELAETNDLKKFFAENEMNLRDFTLAEYLNFLLDEKNLSKTDVIKKSELGAYAYHIFAGRKKIPRGKKSLRWLWQCNFPLRNAKNFYIMLTLKNFMRVILGTT